MIPVVHGSYGICFKNVTGTMVLLQNLIRIIDHIFNTKWCESCKSIGNCPPGYV